MFDTAVENVVVNEEVPQPIVFVDFSHADPASDHQTDKETFEWVSY